MGKVDENEVRELGSFIGQGIHSTLRKHTNTVAYHILERYEKKGV